MGHRQDRGVHIFYGGSLLTISILLSALWGAVVRDHRLLRPEVGNDEVNAILLATRQTSASTSA